MEEEADVIKSLIACGLVAVWKSDSRGCLVGCASSWEILTGQSLTEGARRGWHVMLVEEDMKSFGDSWREAVAKPSNVFQRSARVFNKQTGRFRMALFIAIASPTEQFTWNCQCVLQGTDQEENREMVLDDLSFSGDSIMAKSIREFDWRKSSLGPPQTWPQSLRTAVSFVVHSRFPMILVWGPEYLMFYNDGYIAIINDKHPCLAQPAKQFWPEMWDYLEERFTIVASGQADMIQDNQIFIQRTKKSNLEETFFSYGYSPVYQENGQMGGFLTPVMETTQRVLAERRLLALCELGETTSNALTCQDVLVNTGQLFTKHNADITFALIYEFDQNTSKFSLVHGTALDVDHPAVITLSSNEIDRNSSPWSLAVSTAVHLRKPVTVDNLTEKFGPMPGGPWSDPAELAIVCPIFLSAQETPSALLILGINSRRPLDEKYIAFIDLAIRQVGSALSSVKRQEEMRMRAQYLAEIDATKTDFFSNVSHEFRTPLTLILGPLEECLNDPSISIGQRNCMMIILRNTMRLLKLVNSLLDFSRLEAGRVQGKFTPTDLVKLTSQLTGMFRSLVESGGLQFDVDLQPLDELVFVDNDMWEKIVCNLLSNAFKFTMQGFIKVRLGSSADGKSVQLTVSDSGCGIPEDDLGKLFQRFYRASGSKGRSFEGSGIGLALCAELVKFHNGTLVVESKLDEGSSFTVTIPYGSSHLPHDRVAPSSEAVDEPTLLTIRDGFLNEAAQWLPTDSMMISQTKNKQETKPGSNGNDDQRTILLVDDNSDMREYIYNLLKMASYNVLVATDGQAVVEMIDSSETLPDLILSDVMMPRMNGLELIRHVRNHPRTQSIPVILLSARAGSEASIEGLEVGANDYVIKPFSASELIARVKTQLHMRWLEFQRIPEIEESKRNQEKFVDEICHEIRNPLNGILNNADLLRFSLEQKRQKLESLPADVQALFISDLQYDHEALLAIEACVQHQRMIADDVLSVSRFKEGKLQLEIRDFHIDEVIVMAVRMFEAEIKAKNFEMNVVISPAITPELTLSSDPQRVMQIIVNLLSNAIKFTQPCAVKKVVISADVEIDSANTAFVTITVEDTGIGMTPEQQEKLFQRFSQVQTHNYLGGSGLGLHICMTLATLMNGGIRVKSEQNHGSQFVLKFSCPCRNRSSRTSSEDNIGLKTTTTTLNNTNSPRLFRILVVEDNVINQNVLRRQLQLGGIAETIVVASNGLEAVNMFQEQQQQFHVVIMDVEMPIMGGLEATRLIREIERKLQKEPTLIIGLSGNARKEHIDAALEAGMSDYMVKPFQKDVLLAKINQVSM